MRYLVQITSLLFDPLGYLIIEPLPAVNLNAMRRRANKVATLDLNPGVVVNDRGYVHGDQDLAFRYVPSERDQDTRAIRLLQQHSRVRVSTDQGLFLCVPLLFDPNPEAREFRLSVIEKLEA